MKKLFSLLLALVLIAGSVSALSDGGEAYFVIPNEGVRLNVPAWEEPVGVHTKNIDGIITVTFYSDVDSAVVHWLAHSETDEELKINGRVATYSTYGHKYQPGIAGRPLNITESVAKKMGGLVIDYEGQYAIDLGPEVTSPEMARKLVEAYVDGTDQYYYADEYDLDPWNNPITGVHRIAAKPVWSWFVQKTTVKGQKQPVWKIMQTYGLKVDGPAYTVTAGNLITTHARTGAWMSETIVVENSDVFQSGIGGATAYVTYKKLGDSTRRVNLGTTDTLQGQSYDSYEVTGTDADGNPVYTLYSNSVIHREPAYLYQVKEEYAEGPIASVTAQFRADRDRTMVHYAVEYRSESGFVYRVQYSPANARQNGWVLKDGEVLYRNGSGRYRDTTWVNVETWKFATDPYLESFASFDRSPRTAW